MSATFTITTTAGETLTIEGDTSADPVLRDLLAFLFRTSRQHGLAIAVTVEPDKPMPELSTVHPPRYVPGAASSGDVDAIRLGLETYRKVNAELGDLMRAADRLDVPIAEIARLAGTDRQRVHRAVRSAPRAVEAQGVFLSFAPVQKSKFPCLVGYVHDDRGRRAGSVWERIDGSPRFYAITTEPGSSTVQRQGDGASVEAALQALADELAGQT